MTTIDGTTYLTVAEARARLPFVMAERTLRQKLLAMSVCESYRYLIMECTKHEAWHRIQQMRRAVRAYDRNDG